MQNEIHVYRDIASEISSLKDRIVAANLIGKEEIERLLDSLDSKLKDFRPKLMVYGIYNAGKSTIINALLGSQKAKMSDIPETSTIAKYQYGDYEIFDTPGINAPSEHEKITRRHYKQCELIVFVMSNENVDASYAYSAIKEILEDKKPLIIALNKKQDCSDDDIKMLEQKIYENTAKLGFDGEFLKKAVSVYTINAKSALKGKLENKPKLLEASGFPFFESKVKELLNSSGVQEVIKLCNRNIETFVRRVNENADSNTKDDALKIARAAVTRMENKKRAYQSDIKVQINDRLSIFRHDFIKLVVDDKNKAQLILDKLISEIEKLLKDNIDKVTQEIKLDIETTETTIGKIKTPTIIDIRAILATLANILSVLAKTVSHPTIKAALLAAAKLIGNLIAWLKSVPFIGSLMDLYIENRVDDTVREIRNISINVTDRLLGEIFDPIINNLNEELNRQKDINDNINEIKTKLSDINKKLPVL